MIETSAPFSLTQLIVLLPIIKFVSQL